jgi:hypothetical protein
MEFQDLMLMFFYIAMVADGRAGCWDLLLHGEIL